MAQLTCRDLSLGYEGKTVAEHITFSVNQGDYLCIVGENGSGKSTLMKTILGLIAPLSGTIETGDGIQKNDIGYLPQQTPVQKDFPASVWEIVLSGCQSHTGRLPFYTKKEKVLAHENMKKMHICDLAHSCYRDLSGGQQQRVLLARALCAAKSVLLLDEPVAGLDPKVTEEMYATIEALNRDDKMTVIMISHDLAASVRYASHILHVGEEIFFGTTQEYLKNNAKNSFSAKKGAPKE